MKREGFKSRLGFLLVSAGCAIGIGNVWKFPYVTGQNGGGLFVLFYLLFLVIMGALGYNLWSSVHLIGGRDILNSEDFIVSNLLLPIGALVFTIFCVTKFGWGFDNFQKEANTGKGFKIPNRMKYYFRYVCPCWY